MKTFTASEYKLFEQLVGLRQAALKKVLSNCLKRYYPAVVETGDYIYCEGTIPIALVAHMDTVHLKQCREIRNINGKMSSPQGIGGDDRCGIFIIMNIVKELHCSVLLCEDEEKGGIGARKFTKAIKTIKGDDGKEIEVRYITDLGVNYMVEFDRKGSNDAGASLVALLTTFCNNYDTTALLCTSLRR